MEEKERICPECGNPFTGRGEHDARLGKTWCSHACKVSGKLQYFTEFECTECNCNCIIQVHHSKGEEPKISSCVLQCGGYVQWRKVE